MLMYSICNCSRNSKTANVLSWKATTDTIIVQYKMKVRQSIHVFKSRALDPLLSVLHHKLDICRSAVLGDHAVSQQILSPTAHMHDVLYGPFDTSRSSTSCRLLYGLATRLSNLGIGTFYRVVHFFYMGGILSLPYQFYHHRSKIASRPA